MAVRLPPSSSSVLRHGRLIVVPALLTFVVLGGVWGLLRWVRSTPPPSPSLFQSSEPLVTTQLERDAENTLEQLELNLPNPEEDTDQDGLSNTLEVLYKTDAGNADTDGDGYLDGSEVANGYNPTIPSPNDKVVPSPTPAVAQAPATTSPTTAPTGTLTAQFFTRFGLPPIRASLTENPEQLERFVDEVNARGYLPALAPGDVRTTAASGKNAVSTYLDAISIPQNPKLHAVTATEIGTAFRTFTSTKKSESLNAILTRLRENIATLKGIAVPTEARSIHETYLAATMALAENVELLLRYDQDYVGTLVAAARIEGLRVSFDTVAKGITDLEKKYNIL